MKYFFPILILVAVIISSCKEEKTLTAENTSTITLGSGVDEQDSLKLTGEGTEFQLADTSLTLYWRLKTQWLIGSSPFDLTVQSPDSTWTTQVQGVTNFDNTFLGPFTVYSKGAHVFTLHMVDGNRKLGSVNFTVQ